jgi:hypothetical protein
VGKTVPLAEWGRLLQNRHGLEPDRATHRDLGQHDDAAALSQPSEDQSIEIARGRASDQMQME